MSKNMTVTVFAVLVVVALLVAGYNYFGDIAARIG